MFISQLKSITRCLITALLFLCLPSQAGIEEFNAAMKRGDYATAAAETKSIWPNFDKSSQAASTIAREFAFVNYLNQDFEAAGQFLGHLIRDREPAIEDDQPHVTAVLNALIQHRLEPNGQHYRRLGDVVMERVEQPGLDNISLIGMEYLYTVSWNQGRWNDVVDYAGAAKEFFERRGEQLLVRKSQAELLAIASRALIRADNQDYDAIVDVHDSLVDRIDMEERSQVRAGLIDLKWQAQAWAKAMEAQYTSHYTQTGSNINRDIRPREFKKPATSYFPESQPLDDSRPVCDIEFQAGELSYPSGAGFKGMAGSVILKLDFDEKGRAHDPQLLAAVPTNYFAEAVMKAAPGFTIEKTDDNQADCRLARNNWVQSVSFIIQ